MSHRWARRSPLGRLLFGVLGMLVVFYSVPVNNQPSPGRAALSVTVTLLGIAALAWAIIEQIKRQLRDRSEEVHTLVMLLVLVAIVFALGFFVLEEHLPGQLSGLSTRTDALYFTMSTLTTVGYGDVHASDQVARGLVILQLAFNGVFVAALVSTVSRTIRRRAPQVEEGRKP